MFDMFLTALLPLLMLAILFYGNKKDATGKFFFSKDYTTILKGFCCIFIVIGHAPIEYKNSIQDALSSFGFVRVTLFFILSGYGISLCADKKNGYMKTFWRNRLASLLIPGLLVNILALFVYSIIENGFDFSHLVYINPYIYVLLQYYLLFYIVFHGMKYYSQNTANLILISAVVLSSVIGYYQGAKGGVWGWPYERMGLVWGLLLYFYFDRIKAFVTPNIKKVAIFLALSLVLGVMYLKFKHEPFWGEYLLKIVLGATIITLLFMLSSTRIWGNKIITFFGDIFYEVFLSHMIIIFLIQYLFPTLPSGVFIITSAAATIIISAAIHYLGQPIINALRTKK